MKKRELTEFGIIVKKRLVELGQTQKELANAVGMGDVYLNIVLHGMRSGQKYIKSIADYLELDMSSISRQSSCIRRPRAEDKPAGD